MVAEILKDDFWSLEEMADAVFAARKKRLPTPDARQRALVRRLQTKTDHPPYVQIEGQYFFPKAASREWFLKRTIIEEARRVG